MSRAPLSVLDLVPVVSGETGADALRHSVDLARETERLGYARYWVAEHHLNPGVAGTSPAVVIALLAGATSTIRVGSGAVLLGHRTALNTIEEFGLLDAAYPGRIDLGVGRSGGKPPSSALADEPPVALVDGRTPEGLLVPPKVSVERLLKSPRFALQQALLKARGRPVRRLRRADSTTSSPSSPAPGCRATACPPGWSPVRARTCSLWVLGSSGGESAQVAGKRGLRFATNYHVNPAGVLEAAAAYRAAFEPSDVLAAPHVAVSADVVVAEDEATAREPGHRLRPVGAQHPHRRGRHPVPHPGGGAGLGVDRGGPGPGAGPPRHPVRRNTRPGRRPAWRSSSARSARTSLVVTTITHDHADRVRSYALLAEEWSRR
ncbi:LLM class flavin-dependent oxidoreductase [Nocardioides sp. W3-2-3]|uniref:LLM class flavin-dependent oxidoreductase n=1 Tax=Nocardioides convexus TaxID=2712224 RepID=UPI0024187776|nr:LLM class flavin-dependent oxidoreductase [Nocardioides convexus]NHA00788.1 LLM class flavin-dependent oxidoreductase [Nocardioides convexus]